MAKHLAGGKLTRSHTTLIDAAVPVVEFLQNRPEVSKISLGLIKVIGKGPQNIKFHTLTGGWKLVIRGNISIQEIVVYTNSPESTREAVISNQ